VTAVDEGGQPTQTKLMPVIGMWPLSDLSGRSCTGRYSVGIQTLFPGTTSSGCAIHQRRQLRIGVADARGMDGLTTSISRAFFIQTPWQPARLGVQGGPVTLHGLRLHPGLAKLSVGGRGAVLSASAQDLQAALPPRSWTARRRLPSTILPTRVLADDEAFDLWRAPDRSAVCSCKFGAIDTGGAKLPPDSHASGGSR